MSGTVMLSEMINGYKDKIIALEAENEKLKAALAEIREVWAGSEGGEPVTCQEAYFKRLAKQCYEIAVGALK